MIGYRGEMTLIAAVVALSALYLVLPVRGEPNFGPSAVVENDHLDHPEAEFGPLYERLNVEGAFPPSPTDQDSRPSA